MFLELTFLSPPNRRGNVAFALWFFLPFLVELAVLALAWGAVR
jgi:hypothetical protein